MAWMDFEKFQTRSGNEPAAAQFAKDRSQSWQDAGYSFPSVTPYWQRGFTTEHPGVSPGAGNTRTFQFPGGWGESTAPEFGAAYQDPESEMGLEGMGRGVGNLLNQYINPEQEYGGYEKFQTRSGNEPEAFALQNQVAQDWMEGGYPYPSVTPYLQRGFTTEASGVSPGAGNTRTFQSPDQFSYQITPNPNQTWDGGRLAELLREMGYYEGGAIGLEPGIGSLMRGI